MLFICFVCLFIVKILLSRDSAERTSFRTDSSDSQWAIVNGSAVYLAQRGWNYFWEVSGLISSVSVFIWGFLKFLSCAATSPKWSVLCQVGLSIYSFNSCAPLSSPPTDTASELWLSGSWEWRLLELFVLCCVWKYCTMIWTRVSIFTVGCWFNFRFLFPSWI